MLLPTKCVSTRFQWHTTASDFHCLRAFRTELRATGNWRDCAAYFVHSITRILFSLPIYRETSRSAEKYFEKIALQLAGCWKLDAHVQSDKYVIINWHEVAFDFRRKFIHKIVKSFWCRFSMVNGHGNEIDFWLDGPLRSVFSIKHWPAIHQWTMNIWPYQTIIR